MIIDSSALMAVINDEPEAPRLLRILASTPGRMSVATWLELCIVADSRSTAHGERLDAVMTSLEIELVPVTLRHAEVARLAHRRFGRGSGSRARLNYGDCFAYALSVVAGAPLLYVGEDFSHTDVAVAG